MRAKLDKFLKNNHKCLYMIVFVIVVIIGLIFIFYKQDLNHGSVKFLDSSDLELQITNKLPLTDSSAKEIVIDEVDGDIIDESQFSIVADGDISYEIYLEDSIGDLKISPNYVKVYLTDLDGNSIEGYSNNRIPTISDLPILDDMPNSRRLYSGKLEDGQQKSFVLRMWLSDSYAVSAEKRNFSVKLAVRLSS